MGVNLLDKGISRKRKRGSQGLFAFLPKKEVLSRAMWYLPAYRLITKKTGTQLKYSSTPCIQGTSWLSVCYRWQRASSARCLQNKDRDLTTPRSSNPPFPDSVDVISVDIELSQLCALPQHSCKTLCPACSNVIVPEIEVHLLTVHVTARQLECGDAAPGLSSM
jgi:hypothetical protein